MPSERGSGQGQRGPTGTSGWAGHLCSLVQDGSSPHPGQSWGSGDGAWCPVCLQDGGDGDRIPVHPHNGGDGALCPAWMQGGGDKAGHRSAPHTGHSPVQHTKGACVPAKPSLSHPGTLLPAVTCPHLGNPRLPANPSPSPAATRGAAVIPGGDYGQAVNRGFVTARRSVAVAGPTHPPAAVLPQPRGPPRGTRSCKPGSTAPLPPSHRPAPATPNNTRQRHPRGERASTIQSGWRRRRRHGPGARFRPRGCCPGR